MLISNRKLMITSFFTLALTACGGGGGESTPSTPVTPPAANLAPTVSAGEDSSIRVNTRVILSAEASDSDGSIETYKWEKTSHVAGEEYIELKDTDKALAYFDTNFTITEQQEYTFTVTVTDDDGDTSADEVKITVLPVEHVDIQLPDNINHARLTVLNDSEVLVTGGCMAVGHNDKIANFTCIKPSLRAFVLDINTEALSEVENLNYHKPHPLAHHTTNLLPDGRVFLNAQDVWNEDGWVHYGEIYDPQTKQFTPTSSMNYVRHNAMPVVLENGEVAVFSDFYDSGYTDTIETYSVENDSWEIVEATYPELFIGSIISTNLPNNRVLLIGGLNDEYSAQNKSYIYDHTAQSIVQIDTLRPPEENNGKQSYTGNNGGGDFRRIDLSDDTFCLLSHSNIAAIIDPTPIRFNIQTDTFENDITPCEQWWNVGGYTVEGEVFNNGHVLPEAAHIELKSNKVWATQQLIDADREKIYNEDCDCYNYKEPMTIRIIKH